MPADKRAEVTNELIFETLKAMQGTLDVIGGNLQDIKQVLRRINSAAERDSD